MFCPNCGKELVEKANFCFYCGFNVSEIKTPTPKVKEAEFVQESSDIDTDYIPEKHNIETSHVSEQHDRSKTHKRQKKSREERVIDKHEVPKETSTLFATPEYQPIADDEYNYRDLPTTKLEGVRGVYILDFLIRMTKHGNVPTLIYLIMNVFLVGCICTGLFQLPVLWGMIAGLVVYAASVCVALSPIGEGILRRKYHCKVIVDPDVICYIEPLFREVYYKAKKLHPEISPDIRLFMNDEEEPNAFATGRKTVCITRGLLTLEPETIKAILAHEFGHLAHRDTDKTLVATVGNMIINAIIVVFRICIEIVHVIFLIIGIILGGSQGLIFSLLMHLYSLLILAIVVGLNKLWTFIGICLIMKTSRQNEYDADAFAYQLGYGKALSAFFYQISEMDRPKYKGVFAALCKSHPDDMDRVAHLKELELGMRQPDIF